MKILPVLMCILSTSLSAQTVTWTEITSSYQLPAGIRIHSGERATPLQKLFSIDVDLDNPLIVVRPYISTASGGKETLVPFLQRVGALAGVNGGYFGGSTSYSAVVYPNEVMAQNIAAVTRTAGVYNITRSFFGLSTARKPAINWIYHFGATTADIYRYAAPTPNTQTTPAAAPAKAGGTPYDSLLAGIGGGPTLVKGGVLQYTYDEEAFFGSGVDGESVNPRTAVGFTATNHVILLVADGRQAGTSGVTLPDLAQIMISLGCVEAMNLDGGGSTQMAAKTAPGYQYVDIPSESRDVPTILAAVYADSLVGAKLPVFEKVIDTGDSASCTLLGGGWFESANPTWWGSTKAQLAPVGTGDKVALFKPRLPRQARYELYGWWVASSNRSTSTPIIVRRGSGTDTIRVDQTLNGSRWVKMGTYTFTGDTSEAVIISNATASGSYVCADAIRLLSFDPSFTAVGAFAGTAPGTFLLQQNYPNPFNPSTTIEFSMPSRAKLDLRLFDVLGREVAVLASGEFPPGAHRVCVDMRDRASGVYFYRLKAGGSVASRRMVVMR
jgi:hypothetical protein